VQYHFGEHLGGSHVVVGGDDATADDFTNREEYFAYGETSFGSFARKRYRYGGKERDEETGFYYHGGRYYAPALCRWTSPDPIGAGAGVNSYCYVNGAPLTKHDPSGHKGVAVETTTAVVTETDVVQVLPELEELVRNTWNFVENNPEVVAITARAAGQTVTATEAVGIAATATAAAEVALIAVGVGLVAWTAYEGYQAYQAAEEAKSYPDTTRYMSINELKKEMEEEKDTEFVNLDSSTVTALAVGRAQGGGQFSGLLAELKDKQVVLTHSAYEEAQRSAEYSAERGKAPGPNEMRELMSILAEAIIVPDTPSARFKALLGLPVAPRGGISFRQTYHNDIMIFGTGDELGIRTFSSDKTFWNSAKNAVKGWLEQDPNKYFAGFKPDLHETAKFLGI
jgi:RHS repeat-associated protein